MARTQYETTSKYGVPIFTGGSTEDPKSLVPEGYSLDKAYQDQEPADYLHTRTTRGAGKGMQTSNSKAAYYKIEKPAGPASEAPASTPEAPEAETKPATPVELSPEIQQAKERVKNYEASIDGSAGSNFNSDNVDYNNVNEEQAPNDEAATSFLDAKKTSLKDKMTFTPAS